MGFKTLDPSDDAIERHARKCLALSQAARAWESCVERARILRGRPLPGSLKPEPKPPMRGKPRREMAELRAKLMAASGSTDGGALAAQGSIRE